MGAGMLTSWGSAETMSIEAVSKDGIVVARFFGGYRITFAVPEELVPYYRRLLPPSARD